MTRNKEKVDEALGQVEQLRRSGGLGDPLYFKCLVSLAYEYLVAGYDQEALQQLGRVDVGYLRTVQPQQMTEDKDYRDVVIYIAHRLLQLGLVEADVPVQTTMPMAKA